MPDAQSQQELATPQDAAAPDASATSALTKQDVQEIVDSAVSSVVGVDNRSMSDIYTVLSSANSDVSNNTVSAQLDYINSGILVIAVLCGAILGAVIMRYFLDHFGRRVH